MEPLPDLADFARLLLEHSEALLRGDADPGPTDLEALYPEELALPAVRRLHEYFLARDPFADFLADLPAGAGSGDGSTYGQTALPAAARLLRRVGMGPEDRLLDLGCGCGAVVLLAAALGTPSTGVDRVRAGLDFGRRAAGELGIPGARFEERDMLEVDLEGFSVLFVAATAFPEDLCAALEARLQGARPGTRIVSASRPFQEGRLRPLGHEICRFSWTGYGPAGPVIFYLSEVSGAGQGGDDHADP